jgi:hypothetical protein
MNEIKSEAFDKCNGAENAQQASAVSKHAHIHQRTNGAKRHPDMA